MNFREIGVIVRLQIQRSALKVGPRGHRVYDTAPLLSVPQLSVSPGGVIALLADGPAVVDIHHADHPHSENAGSNGVSIGFTSSYARMRERFGEHVTHGCAGENILIETGESITAGDLRRGLAIRCGAFDADVWLRAIVVARPCVEFSRYALRWPQTEEGGAAIKDALQFLDDGVRGFYATLANQDGPLVVSTGDRVYWPD